VQKTVEKHQITVRRPKFEFSPERHWHNNNPFSTAFFNALSVSFPDGEKFFVEAVRKFRADLSPDLQLEVAAFSKQEAIHASVHKSLNERIELCDYDLSELRATVRSRLDQVGSLNPLHALVFTVCLEHYTAILAEIVLKDKLLFSSSDAVMADLWCWHSIEEIEHRAVAFDVLSEVTQEMSNFQRWWLRSRVMFLVSPLFWRNRWIGARQLLEQDGYSKGQANWGLFKYLFGSPGLLRKMIPFVFRFVLPGFHPNDRPFPEFPKFEKLSFIEASQ